MSITAEPMTSALDPSASADLTRRFDETYAQWVALRDAVDALRADLDAGPGDEADRAGVLAQFDEQVALADAMRHQVDELARAAERERAGGYGICAGCGQPIPAERLAIFPATTQCVACKSAAR
jgi:DnaK suppressor protein